MSEHQPKTSTGLRDIVDRAVKASENKKANKDACPECKKRAALISMVFRGIRIGTLCRFCPHVSIVDFEKVSKKET